MKTFPTDKLFKKEGYRKGEKRGCQEEKKTEGQEGKKAGRIRKESRQEAIIG